MLFYLEMSEHCGRYPVGIRFCMFLVCKMKWSYSCLSCFHLLCIPSATPPCGVNSSVLTGSLDQYVAGIPPRNTLVQQGVVLAQALSVGEQPGILSGAESVQVAWAALVWGSLKSG